MSIYSDYKAGALSDDEFDSLCAWENAKDEYDTYLEKKEYYTDDDYIDDVDCDGDCEHCNYVTCPLEEGEEDETGD